ncbi:tetratricopeptide repeat protein [Mycobacterium deserti]|uniref:Tetratricopeptide repeat protein n=1 Tax=Mycobacterium deserti TaxID=2978347 RepID=A0ABT2M611_9MYCO|nr:tetratricopeptide repeat protein [Mycobacterium deserti]MCT7657069.1 tetratricopeptide repeat protein [Mycobacterium deserti]
MADAVNPDEVNEGGVTADGETDGADDAVPADAEEDEPGDSGPDNLAAETSDAEFADRDVTAPRKPPLSHVRLATIAGLALMVALGGLTGWLGFRAYQSHQSEEQRNLYLQVGRQGALNLTTIDFQQADADVQRILDSATGTFYDDFQSRARPFIEVVKQAQSKSSGNITEAGLESATDTEGRVLVAVTVNTTNAGAPEQQPRSWRMRITVQKVEDEAKVSNVEFVP